MSYGGAQCIGLLSKPPVSPQAGKIMQMLADLREGKHRLEPNGQIYLGLMPRILPTLVNLRISAPPSAPRLSALE